MNEQETALSNYRSPLNCFLNEILSTYYSHQMLLVQARHICCIFSQELLHVAEQESKVCTVAICRLWLMKLFPSS